VVPKREDEDMDEDGDRELRLARAPDISPITHKLFLTRFPANNDSGYEPPSLEVQMENMEKSFAVLREFQDDGREYIERLEEIRDGLGDVRRQQEAAWNIARRRAIDELREAVASSVHV
jgi:hypothetical protein